ncbi:MAG: GTPase ObgE [Lentisphaeria bacterium]|nr:GTPase ObgE [Lentisphaeria bacterium]MBR3688024.1 GTPase ObgE [Lentisphaeria bacterium]
MFVDRAEITVKAGNGGNGCCSFRREAFVPKGGPNGGDGGDGGDVIFVASTGELTLSDFVFNRHFSAENGGDGRSKDMHGRRGQNLVIKVPLGTIIRNKETGDVLADIDEAGAEVVIAKGGHGGRGNARFATPSNRAPREHEPGEVTEPLELGLELKLIADVALVGYPNAGKSTLLSRISNAHPKVAAYPFTTLHPVIGVMEYPDFRKVTVADIPGLIDGAHLNRGLGHYFLRHIERTKLLIYLVDLGGVDGRDPNDDVRILKNELEAYMEGLSSRAKIVLANKTDLVEDQDVIDDFILNAEDGLEVIPISAKNDDSFEQVKQRIRELLDDLAAQQQAEEWKRSL